MNQRGNDPEDLTNSVIGGYRVLHRLGRGGMSEVYLAFHENLRRHVALKVLRQDLVGSADHQTRFLQEARAAASLVHTNIVQVYDIGQFQNVHYIAQEYIPGNNLRAYIQRRGRLPLAESISILLQTAAALQKAASVGIVHRDIKPENILLTAEGEVKVADFGLARSRSQDTNLTEVGITLGTPLYMSPEQIQGGAVDARSDLYSLGVTAYHMLAGRPPFEGDTALSLALQHMQNSPTDLVSLRPDVPAPLAAIVGKLLAKKPDDRFPSASMLIRALRDVAQELPGRWHGDQLVPLTDLGANEGGELTSQLLRLQSAMRAERNRLRLRWLAYGGTVVASLGLMFGGFAAASQWGKRPLFVGDLEDVYNTPKKDSIEEQFLYAMSKNDVIAWKSLEFHYPPTQKENLSYNMKSWWHLGRAEELAVRSDDKEQEIAAKKRARDSYSKIKKAYEEHQLDSLDKNAIEHVYYLLALCGLMGVERKLAPERNEWKEFRTLGHKLQATLPEKRQYLLETNIPFDLKSVWESKD